MIDSTREASRGSSCAENNGHLGILRGRCPACGQDAALIDYGDIRYCQGCYTYHATDRTTTVAYDAAYVAERYERYATTEAMSDLRRRILETVVHLHETLPIGKVVCARGKLLDVGFGNGAFIRRARECGWDAYGYDVNPTEYDRVRRASLPIEPLPDEERYRVITFFDALEHFEDLEEVRKVSINTDWIAITVPKTPHHFLSRPWKHKRPGEHHFYWWYPRSFEILFSNEEVNAEVVFVDCPEDVIRGKLDDGLDNTFTTILRCRPVF